MQSIHRYSLKGNKNQTITLPPGAMILGPVLIKSEINLLVIADIDLKKRNDHLIEVLQHGSPIDKSRRNFIGLCHVDDARGMVAIFEKKN